MVIAGFGFKKILVDKHKDPSPGLKLDVKLNIKDITKKQIELQGQKAIDVHFIFNVLFDPKIADLELEGDLVYIDSEEKIKDILDSWKKKELTDEVKTRIFNFLMAKCNVKALALEDEFNLPYHLPLPRLNPGQEPDKK